MNRDEIEKEREWREDREQQKNPLYWKDLLKKLH